MPEKVPFIHFMTAEPEDVWRLISNKHKEDDRKVKSFKDWTLNPLDWAVKEVGVMELWQ